MGMIFFFGYMFIGTIYTLYKLEDFFNSPETDILTLIVVIFIMAGVMIINTVIELLGIIEEFYIEDKKDI